MKNDILQRLGMYQKAERFMSISLKLVKHTPELNQSEADMNFAYSFVLSQKSSTMTINQQLISPKESSLKNCSVISDFE